MITIYTIHTLKQLKPYADGRTVGYYLDFENAENSVIYNDLDINEDGYYPYAVIEEVSEGLYTVPRIEFWYKWINDKYERIDKPEEIKCICAFSMG